jgi:hypothetical protein
MEHFLAKSTKINFFNTYFKGKTAGLFRDFTMLGCSVKLCVGGRWSCLRQRFWQMLACLAWWWWHDISFGWCSVFKCLWPYMRTERMGPGSNIVSESGMVASAWAIWNKIFNKHLRVDQKWWATCGSQQWEGFKASIRIEVTRWSSFTTNPQEPLSPDPQDSVSHSHLSSSLLLL